MKLGSDHPPDEPTTGSAHTERPGPTPMVPASARPEVEVVRSDPALRRLFTAWRRKGAGEGRTREFHPVRAAILVGAVLAAALFLPGAAAFLGILAVIIVIHEAGHYLVARRCGMRPTEFFLGFGPTVWSRTAAGGLRWGIKAFPLGGYVKIPGMGPSEEVEASLEQFTYRAAARPRRLAVILAGVTANFAMAVVLFTGYALWTPALDVGPVRAVTGSVSLTGDVSVDTVSALGRLVTGAGGYASSVAAGEVPENRMVSAVGGAQLTDGLLDQHPSRLLLLAGLFSASVAVLNLLPLLPLDGGHAAVVGMEAFWARVSRRPRYQLDPNRFRAMAVVVLIALVALGASGMYIDLIHPLAATVG